APRGGRLRHGVRFPGRPGRHRAGTRADVRGDRGGARRAGADGVRKSRKGAGVAMSVNYKVAHVDEIEGIDYREDSYMRPVRHHLGISAFGTNAWRGENAGDRLVPSHTEDPGNQELYVVLRGRARFEID